LYCSFRAYNNIEENPFGNLCIANNNFCAYIHKLEEIFVKIIALKKNTGNYLFQLAQNVIFKAPCSNFPTTYLIKLFFACVCVRVFILL